MAPRPLYRLSEKVEKTCDICGEKFITSNNRHKRCSPKCSLTWHKTEYIKYIWPYNISSRIYKSMFEEQSGKCKICQRLQSELKTKLNVDHSHESGKVRGLLCNQCNQALGLVKENPETIKRMLEYVL